MKTMLKNGLKRITVIVLAMLITGSINGSLVTVFAEEVTVTASGTCGANEDNLTWTLDSAGTLTISGDGAMAEYYNENQPWVEYTADIKRVVIEDGVTSIGNYAFNLCKALTSIEISDSVTSIGDRVLQYCTGVTSIEIPNSVTSIGDYAFHLCTGVTSIEIPDSVTTMGKHAFYECTGLKSITIGSGLENIGYAAFMGCHGLTSVTIPGSVTSIDKYAFSCCNNLTSVTIENGVTSIGGWAFRDCEKLTSVEIPGSVTSIGENAFYECIGLTSIEIPDNVTSIEDFLFADCSSLTAITIPDNVTSIGSDAFASCTGLTTITIPDSVTSIETHAFYNCSNLASITIGNSVTSIGAYAFNDCSKLYSIILSCYWKSDVADGDFYGRTINSAVDITYTHPAEYSATGNVISAICPCEEVDLTATLDLNSEENIYYTGSAIMPAVTVNYPAGWDEEQKRQPDAENCTYSGNINAGTATCTFTYAEGVEASVSFEILPAPVIITNVSAASVGEGEIYTTTQMEDITLAGMAKADNTDAVVEGTFAFAESVTELTAGTNSYECVFTPNNTANYEAAEGTVSITVYRKVDAIHVTANPDKTAYIYGEKLDLTGAVITATYSDGTTADVTGQITFEELAVGQTEVQLSYINTEKNIVTTVLTGISVSFLENPDSAVLRYNGTTEKDWYGAEDGNVVIMAEGYKISDTLGDFDTMELYEESYTLTYLADGICEKTLYFMDTAGRMTDGIKVDVQYDHTAPADVTYDVEDVTEVSARITVSATESGSGVYEYRLYNVNDNSDIVVNNTGVFDICGLSEATKYEYLVEVVDKAGNSSCVSVSFSTEKLLPVFETGDIPDISGTYGQTLSEMTLSTTNATSKNGCKGTWRITAENATTIYPAVGDVTAYEITFTPEDANKCKVVTTTVVPVVDKKVLTIGVAATGREYEPDNKTVSIVVTLAGVKEGDEVTLNNDETLCGTLSSANAGTYSSVTLPDLTLTGNAAENYELNRLPEDMPLTADVIISKAEKAPNMPAAVANVDYSVDNVSAVSLSNGWVWMETDASKSLVVGTTKATAVYSGADKGNYEVESLIVEIIRAACSHTGGTILAYDETGHWDDCKGCGADLNKVEHGYSSEVIKQPTVDAEGVRIYSCGTCDYSYTEAIGKLEPTPTPEPTATPIPTATPKPTATLVPTVTPMPTATPKPTAIPTEIPASREEIEACLYNGTYYALANEDVAVALNHDPVKLYEHWLNYGMAEGRSASLVFDAKYYLEVNPDVAAIVGNDYKSAYEHFVNYGLTDGRESSPVFDVKYYLRTNTDVAEAFAYNYVKAASHFNTNALAEGRSGSGNFDYTVYSYCNTDVAALYGDLVEGYYIHYINHGRNEGRTAGFGTNEDVIIDTNAVSYRIFDKDYYLQNYPVLARTVGTTEEALYRYWLSEGISLGHVASTVFNPAEYLTINTDVAEVVGNDLGAATNHFLNYGIYEGRTGVMEFDYTVYKYCNTDVVEVFGEDVVGYYFHYVKYGRAEGRTAKLQ